MQYIYTNSMTLANSQKSSTLTVSEIAPVGHTPALGQSDQPKDWRSDRLPKVCLTAPGQFDRTP